MEPYNVTNKHLSNFLVSEENVHYNYDTGYFDKGIFIIDKIITVAEIGNFISFDETLTVENSVHFINCVFNCQISFNGSIFNKQVLFENCTFNKSFDVGVSIYRKDGSSNIGHDTYFKSLYFDKCTFTGGISILGGHFNRFLFDECQFKNNKYDIFGNDFYIQSGLFEEGISILGGTAHGNIDINGGYFKKVIYFGNKFESKSKIVINDGRIHSISMYDVLINELFINESYGNYIPEITIEKTVKKLRIGKKSYNRSKRRLVIKKLNFKFSPEYVSVNKNCIIQECIFKEYDSSSNSTISFHGTTIEKLDFEYFNNYGKINFFSIQSRKSASEIICNYANLGTIDFISCDLSKYDIFIDNTKLIGIFYTSTHFPKNILSKKNSINSSQQLRDTYDQLQTVSIKQGDRILSLEWQKKSLTNYRNSLKKFNSKYLILTLMLYSNNFRTKSSLAVAFTFFSSIILFYLYVIFYTGRYPFENINVLYNYAHHIFEFMNPTHRNDFIGKSPAFPIASSLIDFLGRVVIGFGIYQTIQAFRRYGKE